MAKKDRSKVSKKRTKRIRRGGERFVEEPKIRPIEELYNIVVAIVLIALIFAYNPRDPIASFDMMPQAVLAVAIALLFHVAAQKILAHRLGCGAFYKLWFPGMVVSLLLMVIGIKPIILLGAVTLSSYKFARFGFKSRETSITEMGWVAVSGILVNMALASIFYSASFRYLAFVNVLFALFSLVPIKQLNGGKVFMWNPVYWLLLVFALVVILTPSGILTFITP